MSQFSGALVKELEKKGIAVRAIPGFIRSFASFFFLNPHMNLVQVNKKLQYLGWCDLDYHTLQLTIACCEDDGLKNLDHHIGAIA